MRPRSPRALLAALLLLALPAAALAWGRIDDIRYKVKGSDGNMWAPLLGRGNIVRGNEDPGKITFTFDDGPDHRTTPVLLDALDRHGIKAAFFVNGHRFHPRTAGGMDNQAVLREIYRRGHYIGNHTFSHKDITAITDDDLWRQEVVQVEQQISAVIGRRPWLFRPPFGATDARSLTRLSTEGYTVVMWNLDPMDWKATSARDLLERTKRVIEENPEGGVLLMHDTNRTTAEAIPLIVEWIEERNAQQASIGKPPLEIVGIEHFVR